MSETSDLTRPIIDALNQTGGMAIRMNSGKIRSGSHFIQLHEKGTADILFFPRTSDKVGAQKLGSSGMEWRIAWSVDFKQPCWIETKTGKSNKEQIENQAAFKEKVEALGHRYIRATTIDEGLKALGH